MRRKTIAALLAALSICVLAACTARQESGEAPDADVAASGQPLPANDSSPEKASDAMVSDVSAADGDVSWQGDPAWDFTAEMTDGTSFTLSEQAGKAVLVNCGESAEVVDAFLERNGYALPVAYDPATTIAGAYGVNAIPRTVVFGRDGTVVADYTGSRDYDTFKSAINGALGG